MRITLSALSLIAFAQIAMGQSAPSDVIADSTIRISADGICHVQDSSMPCVDVAQYLLSKHLAQNGHVHIVVDATSKYESVAAALKSLQSAGLKMGLLMTLLSESNNRFERSRGFSFDEKEGVDDWDNSFD